MSKFSCYEKANKIYASLLMVVTLIDGTSVYGILRKAEHYQLFFMFNLTRKARMKRKCRYVFQMKTLTRGRHGNNMAF